jgi:(1->4)-alpha-D-glucan 1-alpha-D-glucosylmutase
MLATTTHDTKRSEDVRARLNVLSEIPADWRNAVQRFSRINKRWRREVDGEPAPRLQDEYLFYQSVLGIWPVEPPAAPQRRELIERLQAYMDKAVHEAKQRTSWLNPSRAYDEAVRDFVAKTLRDAPQNRFVAEVQNFLARIAAAGQYNALAQVVLKLLSPGVPDIYQGQEAWDYSLVDPDNRRSVDFNRLSQWLGGTSGQPPDDIGRRLHDPRLKILVTQRLLAARRRLAHLWSHGDYVPLDADGPLAEHLLAFGWRGAESQRLELVAAVPRFVQRLIDAQTAASLEAGAPPGAGLPANVWEGTTISVPGWPAQATSVFTGRTLGLDQPLIEASQLFADFPVAVVELGETP